jgi:hypothetical protein
MHVQSYLKREKMNKKQESSEVNLEIKIRASSSFHENSINHFSFVNVGAGWHEWGEKEEKNSKKKL